MLSREDGGHVCLKHLLWFLLSLLVYFFGNLNIEYEKWNWKIVRGQPELNRWPLDLQSNALPLSYTPDGCSRRITLWTGAWAANGIDFLEQKFLAIWVWCTVFIMHSYCWAKDNSYFRQVSNKTLSYVKINELAIPLKFGRPRRDSNSQSSDPKSDALSIRPRGLVHNFSW